MLEATFEEVVAIDELGRARFAKLDDLGMTILRKALSGSKLVESDKELLGFIGLSEAERSLLHSEFSIQALQGRGSWFVPDVFRCSGGHLNALYYLGAFPRHAMSLAEDEQSRVPSAKSPDHVFAWAVAAPLMEVLIRPLRLRGMEAQGLDVPEISERFQSAKSELEWLSESAGYALQLIDPDSGWSKLSSAERVDRKRAYVRRLGSSLRSDAFSRFRVGRTLSLIRRYYSKAKNGAPSHRVVLNKDTQPILAAFFGGDWFRFLEYVGERPSQDEQVHTSLPEKKLLITTEDKLLETAKRLNLPVGEVANVVSGFWNSSSAKSPAEARFDIMERYWAEVFKLHDRQRSGQAGLWGLVAEQDRITWGDEYPELPFSPGLYRKLLSIELQRDIDSNWASITNSKTPAIRIPAHFPHNQFTDAFGPALRFWNNCTLTAWFVSEGPYSRTDMAGLDHHQRREIASLSDMGFAVDPRLFSELVAIERRLGPPRDVSRSVTTSTLNVGTGQITFSTTIGGGQCRGGYEQFRDVLRRFRESWSSSFLRVYLRKQAEGEIGAFAEQFAKSLALKGKAPSLKSMAKLAVRPANHWFGGDIALLYAAIGEKLDEPSCFVKTVPFDVSSVAYRAFQEFDRLYPNTRKRPDPERDPRRIWALRGLAVEVIRFCEMSAICGSEPSFEAFGRDAFEQYSAELKSKPDLLWREFLRVASGFRS